MWLWACLPAGLTALLWLVCLVPKYVDVLNQFMPLLPLVPIFYWGIHRAGEMPYWFVFTLGLFMDVISGVPLGLTSLLYMVFLGIAHTQYKYVHKEGFVIQWGYFAVLLLTFCGAQWLCMSLVVGQAQSLLPASIQWVLTAACYPLLQHICNRLQETIAERRWQILHGH